MVFASDVHLFWIPTGSLCITGLIPTDVLKYAKTAAYFGILITELISFNTSERETK
jgi:hypothetical protein